MASSLRVLLVLRAEREGSIVSRGYSSSHSTICVKNRAWPFPSHITTRQKPRGLNVILHLDTSGIRHHQEILQETPVDDTCIQAMCTRSSDPVRDSSCNNLCGMLLGRLHETIMVIPTSSRGTSLPSRRYISNTLATLTFESPKAVVVTQKVRHRSATSPPFWTMACDGSAKPHSFPCRIQQARIVSDGKGVRCALLRAKVGLNRKELMRHPGKHDGYFSAYRYALRAFLN